MPALPETLLDGFLTVKIRLLFGMFFCVISRHPAMAMLPELLLDGFLSERSRYRYGMFIHYFPVLVAKVNMPNKYRILKNDVGDMSDR